MLHDSIYSNCPEQTRLWRQSRSLRVTDCSVARSQRGAVVQGWGTGRRGHGVSEGSGVRDIFFGEVTKCYGTDLRDGCTTL